MLKNQLNRLAVTEGNMIRNPQLGMIVAVFMHGMWHRASISSYHPPNITLFMVDEGTQVHKPMAELKVRNISYCLTVLMCIGIAVRLLEYLF